MRLVRKSPPGKRFALLNAEAIFWTFRSTTQIKLEVVFLVCLLLLGPS